jgi:NAD-reducing hydrogenase small subunit
MSKVRVATVWLDGCSGCHMSFLDMDERLIALAERIDLVYSPLVDRKEFPERVDVTLVEGAVATEDLEKIRHVRAHTKVLVALGDCAVTSNVPSMRNGFPVAAIVDRAYRENVTVQAQTPSESIPASCRRCAPCTSASTWTCSSPAVRPRPTPSTPWWPTCWRAGAAPASAGPLRLTRSTTERATMANTITIDPVTRIEGHAKITIHSTTAGRERRPPPRHAVPRVREVLRGAAVLRDAVADGAHLRHLPGEPPDRLGQGVRRADGRAHPAAAEKLRRS